MNEGKKNDRVDGKVRMELLPWPELEEIAKVYTAGAEKDLSDEHFLCLVISELMEAVEADRKEKHANMNKFNQKMDYFLYELQLYGESYDIAYREMFEDHIKDTVEDELADACIRLLDLAGLRKADLGETNEDELKCSEGFFDWTFTESIFSIVCDITDLDFFDKYPFDAYLRASIRLIMGFAVKRNIDIFWHIEQKIKYNELRPYKHGGRTY